jgi:hypothetical protein
VFKFIPHAVVSVVIAIAVFCIIFLFADHPAALATVASRIRVEDVMTGVVLTDRQMANLRVNRASVHFARRVTFPSHPFHSFSLIALLHMLSKVIWFNVTMPSVEGTRQRFASQLDRVVKFRFDHVDLLVCLFQLWFVPVGIRC